MQTAQTEILNPAFILSNYENFEEGTLEFAPGQNKQSGLQKLKNRFFNQFDQKQKVETLNSVRRLILRLNKTHQTDRLVEIVDGFIDYFDFEKPKCNANSMTAKRILSENHSKFVRFLLDLPNELAVMLMRELIRVNEQENKQNEFVAILLEKGEDDPAYQKMFAYLKELHNPTPFRQEKKENRFKETVKKITRVFKRI